MATQTEGIEETHSGASPSTDRQPKMSDTHPVQTTEPEQRQSIMRALLEAGGLDALVRKDAPHIATLSAEEREASLRETLAARPNGPLWLFAYGSLMWNPVIVAWGPNAAEV